MSSDFPSDLFSGDNSFHPGTLISLHCHLNDNHFPPPTPFSSFLIPFNSKSLAVSSVPKLHFMLVLKKSLSYNWWFSSCLKFPLLSLKIQAARNHGEVCSTSLCRTLTLTEKSHGPGWEALPHVYTGDLQRILSCIIGRTPILQTLVFYIPVHGH